MTARDLLQQRYTLPNGDTAWRSSPLVNAAREGKLVLLDGIHRVNAGTLAVLQRFVSQSGLCANLHLGYTDPEEFTILYSSRIKHR